MIKGVGEAIKNEAKELKGGLVSMSFGKLDSIFLEKLLTGKGVKAKIPWLEVMRPGAGTIATGLAPSAVRVGQGF